MKSEKLETLRKKAEEALRSAHDELEIRVRERTAELQESNKALQAEIQERKKAEEALKNSEERYRNLFENMTEMFQILEPILNEEDECIDFRYIEVNRATEAFAGKKREEIEGKTAKELWGIVEDYWFEMLGRVLKTGESARMIDYSKELDVYYDVYAWKADERKVAIVFSNITERKKTEEALQESEERFRVAQELLPDGFTILRPVRDAQGQIVDFTWVYENAAIARLNGTDPKAVVGQRLLELFPGHRGTSFLEAYQQVAETGEPRIFEAEYSGESLPKPTYFRMAVVRMNGDIAVLAQDITERKRAEEALRESDQKYSSLFANKINGMAHCRVITDEQGKPIDHVILAVNEAYERIVGIKKADIEGRLASEIFPDIKNYALDFIGIYGRIALEGGEIKFEQDLKTTNKYLSVYAYSPKHGEFTVIFTDITEQKQNEEALRESEERFRAFVTASSEVVYRMSPDWSEMRRLHGRDFLANTEEPSATWLQKYIHPDDQPHMTAVINEAVRTKSVFQLEHRVLRADGSLGWTFSRAVPLMNASSEIVEWFGAASDITERKRAEETLRSAHDELELRVQERTAELKEANKALMESEASYRDLTESIEDLFYAMDGELRCTYWNKASESFTGVLAKDAIGKSLFELFPAVRGASVEQLYIEALKIQQPQRFENEYQLGDKKFIFEINAYPTKTGLSVIAKDITEKKMFEAHLLRAQRMESIGTLAGGIAHDLNNILTPMMMSLRMLKEKLKDEKSQKLLTILEQNSQRGADLIKQVLSFARGVEGERNPLAAKHIITEIERIAKETFPRNIQITTDIPKDLFTISGDATQLHQVIMNLCVNARDAMPDGGILNISAENSIIDDNYARMNAEAKVGSYAVIAVSDTGVGIPYNILDRIFEPFFTTKEFGKGTGLGLSTALAIVKSHGGFINVNSEIGKGTTFRVCLPAINAEMQNVEEQQLELPIGKGELVLVTEDEDSIREITCSTLEENGYKVITAIDGAEAVALLAKNIDEIKVILMDLMMPVMDGHASIKAIRKISPEVKIVTVSGLAEKEKLKNVADITNAFLSKPYTAEKLLKIIHEVLNT